MTTTVVTGAAGGIGRSVVAKLLARGRHVTALDLHVDGLADIAENFEPTQLHRVEVDLRSENGIAAVAAEISGAGRKVSGLVNNAGIMHGAAGLAQVSLKEWNDVIEVNLTGTFLCMRQFVADLIDTKGAIVNVASVVGLIPGPMRGAYSPSKAAIVMLTQQAALEWAPAVRVNAVCPGLLITPLSAPQYADPVAAAGRIGSVPLQRVADIEEVSDAICFLLSDEASYITGCALPVDGGIAISAAGGLGVAK
jgi:glucose 1-dehydrogenase